MKKLLPIFVIACLVIAAGLFKFSVFAQDSDTQTSDYALDVQNGEKDTANDSNAQEAQQGVNQDEEVQAAADDGDPSTGLIQAALDEAVAPEEANESAKLVENPQATSSENDDGATLQDQSVQTSQEKPNEDVAIQDDNKAPSSDPDTQPQASSASQEQPLDNLQSTNQQNQPSEQTQPDSNAGSQAQ